MDEKHPDAPGGGSVDEELTDETRESMDRLGRSAEAQASDSRSSEDEDEDEGPGQNSDRLPQ